jgi:hypothetical protein
MPRLCSDKTPLESVDRLLSFLFDFTLVGGALFFIIRLLQFQRNLHSKNELQKIQARISILRINLKGKVKKRANSFRNYFVKSIVPGENYDRDLNEILEIKFETSADFQKYFDLIQGLHSFVSSLTLLEHPADKYIAGDEQTELMILRIVKEMQHASALYNNKIENFNKLNPKTKWGEIDPMQFSAMTEIDRILQTQAEPEKPSTDTDENAKAA